MATNQVFEPVGSLGAMPVPDGTASGDPILLFDEIPAVALTDEGDGGNADNHATVAINPMWVYSYDVVGADGAGNAPIAIGDRVYLDAAVVNADVTNGTFYGWALAAVASGATTNIPVLLASGPLA